MAKKLMHDYIVVEGNIGTGKTSLARKISADFNTRLVLERFEENPFLPLFYDQPSRYAFPLELSFLADRYQQLNDEIAHRDLFRQQTVSDYILSKSMIFANITLRDDEKSLYQRLFNIINPNLPRPDILVYLHKDVSILMNNIRKRGRSYENNITEEYLAKLEEGYWNYFKHLNDIRIVVIDSNEIDFVNDEMHYNQILEIIGTDYQPGIHRILPEK